MLLKLEVK